MAGRRTFVAASAATFALAAAALLIGPVADATPTGQPAVRDLPAQTTEVGVRIELVDQAYAFEPDGSLRLVYRLTGDLDSLDLAVPETTTATTTTTVAPPASDAVPTETQTEPTVPPPSLLGLKVQVTNYPPLTSADTPREIDRFVGGDVNRDSFGDAIDGIEIGDARPFITFDDAGAAVLTLDVPTDSVPDSVGDRLKFETPGLYPVRTELLAAAGTGQLVVATHGTIVQRLPGPADGAAALAPVGLSVLASVTAGNDEATAEFSDAVALAEVLDAPLTIDAPPPIVAEAAATPVGAAHLAAALAGDEFVAVPAVPLDVSSAVEVGRGDDFARLLSAGENLLTEAVPTTPSRRNTWVVLEPLSAAGAQELRDLGVRLLVMSQDLYGATIDTELPATDLFVNVALPDGDTLPLLVVDSISDELTATATDDVLATATPIEWAVETVSAILVDDTPAIERSLVLSTPELGVPDPRLLTALEQLATTTPSITFRLASTLTGTTDTQTDGGRPVVVDLPASAGPSLVERVALIEATALSAASAGSMLPAGDPRPERWAAELDSLLTTSISDEEAAAVAAGVQAEADAVRAAVVPPEPFKFTLTGRSGDIEVKVGNTSTVALDVVLRMSSPKLSFPDSTPPEDDRTSADTGDHHVTLRPDDETSVIIPVRAKSNGTSPITVEVLTPAGESIAEPVTITSRVTAFTGLGQVLTAAFILVLLTWWFAHWRNKRRADIEQGRDRHPSVAP